MDDFLKAVYKDQSSLLVLLNVLAAFSTIDHHEAVVTCLQDLVVMDEMVLSCFSPFLSVKTQRGMVSRGSYSLEAAQYYIMTDMLGQTNSSSPAACL